MSREEEVVVEEEEVVEGRMNIEVDVYGALETLLLQDALADTIDDKGAFASKHDSTEKVRFALKFKEETPPLRNAYVVVKYGRKFESKRVYMDNLGFMVNDGENVCIPTPSKGEDALKLVFEVWSADEENCLVGIGQTSRLREETVVKIRNPLSAKDATVAILAIVVL